MTMIMNNGVKNTAGRKGMNIIDRVKKQETNLLNGFYSSSYINKKAIESLGIEVEGSKLINKQKTFATMSYAYGSKVGVTTTAIALGLTILTNPDQYFYSNGVLNLAKIRKVFKKLGIKAIEGQKYNSVFIKFKNKETAINKFGKVSDFVKVSNTEIFKFMRNIEYLDYKTVTKADLITMAKDLDIIGRALQELSIDVTKDKSKDIGVSVMNFLTVSTKTTSRQIKKKKFTNNINNIINEHINNKNIISEYKISYDYNLLKDVDSANKAAMAKAVVEDISGEMMQVINEGYEEGFKDLIKLFKMSNGNMYDRYKAILISAKTEVTVENKKAAHMIRCARIAINAINSLYGAKDSDATINSAYVTEVGKKLRAGLYTEGAKIGICPKDVVEYAIAASFCYLKDKNIVLKKNPSLSEIWTIFPKEFIIDYVSGSEKEKPIKDVLTVTYASDDLYLDDELFFEDGYAESEDKTVMVAENYTGKAIVTEYGLEAVVDHYAHEPTHIAFLKAVYERNISSFGPEYTVPTALLEQEQAYSNEITNMVRIAEQSAVAQNGDFLIKKGNNISIVGKLLSIPGKENMRSINDAVISVNGGVIIFA